MTGSTVAILVFRPGPFGSVIVMPEVPWLGWLDAGVTSRANRVTCLDRWFPALAFLLVLGAVAAFGC